MSDDNPIAEIHFYLTVRCAALLVAHNGRVPMGRFKDLAKDAGYLGSLRRPDGTSYGSVAGRAARNAVNDLVAFGLARKIEMGRTLVADDLGAVVEWMAAQVADGYTPNLGAPERLSTLRRAAVDPGYLHRVQTAALARKATGPRKGDDG